MKPRRRCIYGNLGKDMWLVCCEAITADHLIFAEQREPQLPIVPRAYTGPTLQSH